jgi:protein transport protein SEC23
LKDLLEAPYEDVALIMEDRFPVPRLIRTYYNHGHDRFLKSRVNPSVTTVSNQNVETGNYITDDASLKVFTDHLIRLAVQTPS